MTDLQAEYVSAAWSDIAAIRHLYSRFASKRPVMLLELPTRRVYAYPFHGFRADLSARSQALLDDQYAEATRTGEMVVFVRDEERRKLVSFSLVQPARAPDQRLGAEQPRCTRPRPAGRSEETRSVASWPRPVSAGVRRNHV
jgi:hypothetical protein